MGTLSKKLRSFAGDGKKGIAHWCPGCESAHSIWTENAAGRPVWTWDGNVDAPTTTPSVRIFTPARAATADRPAKPEKTRCHYFLKAGKIEYCGDCEHALSGKTVDLPDFPPHWGGFD